jgi:hypothetical protein
MGEQIPDEQGHGYADLQQTEGIGQSELREP